MLNDPLTVIKGIGPRRAELFGRLGLTCVNDLIRFYPRAHLDFCAPVPAASLKHGDTAMVRVVLMTEPKLARIRKGLEIVSAQGQDETGRVLLCWYNQPYRRNTLKWGDAVFAAGRVDTRRGIRLVNPAIYAAPPGLLPVYPLTKGLTQSSVRDAVKAALSMCLEEISETLDASLRDGFGLCEARFALENVHFPSCQEALERARRRLSFEDMLLFKLMTGLMRGERAKKRGEAYRMDGIMDRFAGMLPYKLTAAQQRCIGDISRDLSLPQPMNRLVQGDVGSGKTAVAFFAMFAAAENGRRALMMAPTEILARQHYENAKALFGDRVALLTGGMSAADRDTALRAVASGADMIIGTHALITENVSFERLGLVIADEQHRFGVRQRAALSAKGDEVNVLIMSATPIPRTLALLIYGDLDLSVIDETPPGRRPVRTNIVPEEKRGAMYAFIDGRALSGRQAYVVCPLVQRSEAMEDVQSATELYEELAHTLKAKVGLLHGQMSSKSKAEAIESFRRGETKVLISTTVVEVGMDVENASVMAVEGADRFGLAQLHQLRGRVGRSSEQAYCFLLSGSDGENAKKRLSLLTKTNDGFKIAEQDLMMRGPGELLGERQHGTEGLAIALGDDMACFRDAAQAADAILCGKAEGGALMERARELLEKKTRTIAAN